MLFIVFLDFKQSDGKMSSGRTSILSLRNFTAVTGGSPPKENSCKTKLTWLKLTVYIISCIQAPRSLFCLNSIWRWISIRIMNDARRECSFSTANTRQREYRIVHGRVNQLRNTISRFYYFCFWGGLTNEILGKNLVKGITHVWGQWGQSLHVLHIWFYSGSCMTMMSCEAKLGIIYVFLKKVFL